MFSPARLVPLRSRLAGGKNNGDAAHFHRAKCASSVKAWRKPARPASHCRWTWPRPFPSARNKSARACPHPARSPGETFDGAVAKPTPKAPIPRAYFSSCHKRGQCRRKAESGQGCAISLRLSVKDFCCELSPRWSKKRLKLSETMMEINDLRKPRSPQKGLFGHHDSLVIKSVNATGQQRKIAAMAE
jgi:hypothetical protein